MEENKTSIGSIIATIIIIALIVLGGLYFWGKRIEQAQSAQSFTVATTTEVSISDNSNNVATTTLSDWKAYSSIKYKFGFNYPKEWNFRDGSNDQNQKLDPWVDSSYQFCDQVVPAGILNGQKTDEYCNGTHMIVQVWKLSQPDPVLPLTNLKKENITVNGVKGVKISGEAQGTVITQSIFVFRSNNYSYVFFPQMWQVQHPGDTTIDQIISTFKFTK